MHTKWLTYRVSWCNVRVKLGQSLWAGGALAKRLPLLQETDRQWEKNTSVSQCSDITHLHHQPEPPTVMQHRRSSVGWRRGGDATSSASMKTIQTRLTLVQNSRLPPQSEEWEKRCWIIRNYVWGWNESWWMDGKKSIFDRFHLSV